MPETLHFTIQGEFVTNKARQIFYENNDFIEAIRIIMHATVTNQLTEEQRFIQACKILNGELKTAGVYPGEDYGVYDDTPDEPNKLVQHFQTMKAKLNKTEAKLAKLESKLETLGAVLPNNTKREINDILDEYGKDPLFDKEPEPTLIEFNGTSITPSQVQDTLDHIKSESETEDYGWLSPTGKFFPSEFGTHTASAIKLAKQYYPEEYNLKNPNARLPSESDQVLYEHGWILMHNPMYGTAMPSYNPGQRITKSQKDFIYKYYFDRNKTHLVKEYLPDM